MTTQYDPFRLHVIGYGDGFTAWAYRSRDPLAALAAPGYFATAYGMFRDGDRLAANALDADGLTAEAQDFVVLRRHGRVALVPMMPAVRLADALAEAA